MQQCWNPYVRGSTETTLDQYRYIALGKNRGNVYGVAIRRILGNNDEEKQESIEQPEKLSTFRYCFSNGRRFVGPARIRIRQNTSSPTFETKSKPSSHTCSESDAGFRENFNRRWQSEDPLLKVRLCHSVHIVYRQVLRLKP